MESDPSWFSSQRYADDREAALKRFGRMLRVWRVRNNWTQYTASQWAKEAGFQAMAAGNLSNIEHGKAGNLRPSTIFQLADLNQRIANSEWGSVRSVDLRARLKEAQPIVDRDGRPWGPTEFWACSVGLLPVPPGLDEPDPDPAPGLSDDAARMMSMQWRGELQEVMLERKLDPLDALTELSRLLPQQYRRRFRQVMSVSGAHYSASELEELWENGWLPEIALHKWIMQISHN